MSLTLADFEGRWHLDRSIGTEAGTARFEGMATLTPGDGGHEWREAGTLVTPQGAAMPAERRYLWRASGPLIEVAFDDGRSFHAFDPSARSFEVRHDCPPDDYRGCYDLGTFPDWSVTWRVSGPRKGYVSVTRHRRLAPAGPLRHLEFGHAKERP